MRKIKELGQLLESAILFNFDVVDLYLNILNGEGLAFRKRFWGSRVKKQLKIDTMIKLIKLVINFCNILSNI